MSIGYSDHQYLTTQLKKIIQEVGKYKEQVGRGDGGQELAVLHTDLRKCLAWCDQIPAEQDDVDKPM